MRTKSGSKTSRMLHRTGSGKWIPTYVTFVSEHYEMIAGIKPAKLIGKTRREMYKAYIPEEKHIWIEFFATLEAKKDFHGFVYTYIRPDGQRRVFVNHGKATFDQLGNFSGYRGVGSDITKPKQTEEELRQAKETALEAQREAETANQDFDRR